MDKYERADAIRQFSEQNRFKVFLISLRAGAYGLNLIAANHVLVCDPWYNPAVEVSFFYL
jgi:DNA repair protein RAD5